MKRVVLDASALMIFFLGGSGAEKVRDLITAAAEGKMELSMSAVNWGEVYYSVWRDRGRESAERTLAYIAHCRIEVAAADMTLTKLAAEFHARYKLPYADCFAAALARQRKATLIASDADFRQIKNEVDVMELHGRTS